MHGLVRTRLWSVTAASALADGSTELRMALHDSPETRAVWPHEFELEMVISVGKQLRVEWLARNPGSQPYTYTGAFHPYFAIRDIADITIHGLEQTDYLDKPDAFRRKTQPGALKFAGEVDRIFLNTTSEILIADPGLGRTIHIAKEHSRTTVVWNPGDKDARMEDVGAGQHRHFVCVEAANAAEDVVTVAPGGEARLGMLIWSEQGAAS
jgi:glucose-6-phosphate 1-epimerase